MSDFADQDFRAWKAWNSNRTQDTTGAVLGRVDNIVKASVRSVMSGRRAGGSVRIPEPVLRGQARVHALNLLNKYDPDRGAKIHTWVRQNLTRNLRGWVASYQNVVRIPSGKVDQIGKVKSVVLDLEDRFGRPPSDAEVADSAKLSLPAIRMIRDRLSRSEYVASGTPSGVVSGWQSQSDRAAERAYRSLAPQDQTVMDLLDQNKKTEDIARTMNMTQPQVTESRARIRRAILRAQSRLVA